MRGHILIKNENGRRWLYVPEAHIQIYVVKNGRQKWVAVAYRTDGYYRTDGSYGPMRKGAIQVIAHLQRDYRWTVELDVPQRLVDFTVESERRRQEEIEGISHIYAAAVETKNPRAGWRAFQAHATPEASDQDFSEEAEHRIGEELDQLMAKAGGLQ